MENTELVLPPPLQTVGLCTPIDILFFCVFIFDSWTIRIFQHGHRLLISFLTFLLERLFIRRPPFSIVHKQKKKKHKLEENSIFNSREVVGDWAKDCGRKLLDLGDWAKDCGMKELTKKKKSLPRHDNPKKLMFLFLCLWHLKFNSGHKSGMTCV